jgi:hypothetical protein
VKLQGILNEQLSEKDFFESVKNRVKREGAGPGISLRSKAKYISDMFPLIAREVISDADDALRGRLILPGTGGKLYFVGNPPAGTFECVQESGIN